jgi:hypothetical protein
VSGFLGSRFVSFFSKSVRLKYVTLVAAVAFLGVSKSLLISIVNVFGLLGGNLPIFRPNLAWYLLAVVTLVSTILWGRVYCGPHLRLRRVHAAGGRRGARPLEVERAARAGDARVVDQVRHLGGALAYFLVTKNPLIYPYIEPFWMFGLHLRTPCCWPMLGTLLDRVDLRPQSLLPLPVPARRVSRRAVEPDRVPHQALVRVQHLQDLSEGVRVGRHRRAEDHQERVRALRRLRAALRRHQEVPAPPDPDPQGRHPGAARADRDRLTPVT